MRRFLLHVLPNRFHRIRHYGLFANASRKVNLTRVRQLLHVPVGAPSTEDGAPAEPAPHTFTCPHCGADMVIVAIFAPYVSIRAPPTLRGTI